jgi:predicted membrane protein
MKQVCLILAAIMLLCLAPMPYGYYQLVRFVAMVVFSVMAFQYYEKKQETLMVVFGALPLLFQPFVKIALGRTLWNVVDVLVAILLIALWLIDKGKGRKNEPPQAL